MFESQKIDQDSQGPFGKYQDTGYFENGWKIVCF